ncbi:MAG: serine hydrolase, partial [Flavobacteriales bacterium]
FGYSNIMYLTAGEIISAVSGMNYDDFIKTKFFAPLGMNSTNSSVKNNPTTNVAAPHAQVNDKNITIPYVDWDNMAPAGSVNSNIEDLSKWVRMWLSKGKFNDKEIIKPSSITQLWNVVTPQPVNVGAPGPRGNIQMGGYALGWNVIIYRGIRVVNHSGGLDGMISHTVLLPEKNMGFVILCNAGVSLPGAMIYDIIDHVCGFEFNNYIGNILARTNEYKKNDAFEQAKIDKERNPDKKPSLLLTDYEGTYSGNVYGAVKISINKKAEMWMTFEHTPTFKAKLEHWHSNHYVFEFKEHPSLPRGWVTFNLTPDGKKVYDMKVDLPNPDFDFTELDLIKQ